MLAQKVADAGKTVEALGMNRCDFPNAHFFLKEHSRKLDHTLVSRR